jgi:KDO2-lipid IV(A) lauroyltransferase
MLRRYTEYYILKILKIIFNILPFTVSIKLGAYLGKILYYLDRNHRKIAYKNLRLVFDLSMNNREIKKIVKKVYINIGQSLAEFFYIPKVTEEFVNKFVDIYGKHYIDSALMQGKGIINVVGHFGNWELINPIYRILGYHLTAVAYPQKNELTNTLINQCRSSSGAVIINDNVPYKVLIDVLKRNEILILVADQDARSHGVFVEFLGRLASTARGPAVLALRTGAPIIVTCLIRQGIKHTMIISEPIRLIKTGNWKQDILINTRQWCEILEKFIYKYPEQWFWLHQRWKTNIDNIENRIKQKTWRYHIVRSE